jgi:hypothetical protein
VTDLDREVRGLLSERAGREEVPQELPPRVRRRVRARQSGVVGGVVALIIVIALPIVAAPGWLERKDEKRGGEATAPVTSTVYGVTITYPDDWTLLQLSDQLRIEGTETSSLLQLSNFDPLDDNGWLCPLPSGRIPDGGVILFVQEIPTEATTDSWPVELREGPAVFGACGEKVARWQSSGRAFQAGVVGELEGAAYGDLIEAFRSMVFEAPDDDPPLGAQDVTVDHAYVLASGRESGQPWNLLAFRYRDISDNVLCILLDPIGPREGSCLPNPVENYPFPFELSAGQVGGTLFAFGKAPPGAAEIQTLVGRSLHLERLPAGLRFPFTAFVGPADAVVADGTLLVEVRIVDAEGAFVDRQQWIENADRNGPDVIAFDHAFENLWWIAHEGEAITLKSRTGVLESIGTGNLPGGEHLRVASHTFTTELPSGTEYETVVFGVSSSIADQVTLMLTTGTAQHASVRILAHEVDGPDSFDLRHVFWLTVPGAVRGEIVAVDTGCLVLAREPFRPDTPPPSLPSPPPESELPCIGP